jgi:hypothetical protein
VLKRDPINSVYRFAVKTKSPFGWQEKQKKRFSTPNEKKIKFSAVVLLATTGREINVATT